jgi:hypothetical protein
MANPLAGFCGDYCGKCPNYPAECDGCVPEKHADCRFVECCLERNIEHCGLCGVFPCTRLVEFCPDDRPGCPPGYHLENLTDRKKVGTEAWLEAKKKEWPANEKPRR